MKGFTLVEMLVALFVFSLIAAASVSIMRFTVDNQGVVRAHAERLAEFQRLRAILKADLSQAAARRIRDAQGRPVREAFSGGQRDLLLRLVRRGWENPDAAPRASAQYFEYRLSNGQLERLSSPALDGAAQGQSQILAGRVRTAAIRFLWHGQWIETLPGGPVDPLPQAVRLDLSFEDFGDVSQLFLVTGEAR
jgi:general secretion pathway protein J